MATSTEQCDAQQRSSLTQDMVQTAAAALDLVLALPNAENRQQARIAVHAWLAAAERFLRDRAGDPR